MSIGRDRTSPSLPTDHPDFKMHLRVQSKDFSFHDSSVEDEGDPTKAEGLEEDDSLSAHGQSSDDQPSSGTTAENQVPVRRRSEEGSQPGGREDVDYLYGSEECKNTGDSQNKEFDIHEDGEFLIRPYLEPGEKVKFRYNCERVLGLDKRDGIFLIGEQCLYVIDNYYLDEEGCIKEKGDEGDISVIDRALGVPMTGPNDSQDDMKPSSGSFGETVASDRLGGRAWACNGGARGKENVSSILPSVYIVGLISYLELSLLILQSTITPWEVLKCVLKDPGSF